MATRAERVENYHAKRDAKFACGECGASTRTLACDSMDGLVVRCPNCIGDDMNVRPGQWQEADEKAEKAKKEAAKK